jgi:hypothetical protein
MSFGSGHEARIVALEDGLHELSETLQNVNGHLVAALRALDYRLDVLQGVVEKMMAIVSAVDRRMDGIDAPMPKQPGMH